MLIKRSILMGLTSAVLLFSAVSSAEIAVVVNNANSAALSNSDISRLFLGKLKKYSAGNKAEPINQKFGTKIRNEFEQKVLKKSANQVKAYWSKRIFSGKGKPPKELSSDKNVILQISANKNAIGYIDASSVDKRVRVIKKF